jgi:cysteine-rich repeat protein
LLAACAGDPSATECATGITCPSGTKCAAVQPICLINDCGDGIVQDTEVCDDGNITNGDGCSADCLSSEACGDGVINRDAGELCDDRNTIGGDGCSADCRSVEVCGNGIKDFGEACDDGDTDSGDGCAANCLSTEVCGNGIKDVNEQCDDGGAPGGCNDNCQGGQGCGDGAIDEDALGNPLEECDDGNLTPGDDCTDTCKISRCGDGVLQTAGANIEQCDPSANFGETAGCNIDCTSASCGDGKLNKAALEQCDTGSMNADNRDCTAGCKVNVCGDGKANLLGPTKIEQCDDADQDNLDGCSNVCSVPTCGNGVIEMLEACDDDNTSNGDGCSSTCKFETCGNGVIDPPETCDPGASFETPTCNSDCTGIDCGDGKVNIAAGEECDDTNAVNDDDCKNDCTLNVCGDGVKSPTEACDDGDQDNTDGCTTSCTTPSCGNGIRDMGEQCDDGNTSNTDGCLTGCVYNTCGDGHRNTTVEECDNGVDNGITKDCLPTCKNNVCGDGFRDMEGATPATTEACDDANLTTETECDYGIASCSMCDSACNTVLTLTGNVCGDGDVDATNEACDDSNTVQEASCAYGTPMCTSFCSSDCQTPLNLTGPFCGDGTVQTLAGEACDDRNANACGRCDAACNVFASTAATGFILAIPGADIADDDTLTINDGFGITAVFEFDKDATGASAMGNIVITTSNTDTAAQMRTKIRQAIDGVASFKVDATDGNNALVLLTHTRKSTLGNQPILDTVNDSAFVVSAMTGGTGGNCAATVACTHNDDCQSGTCTSNVCQ